jgi:hypothetical protein
MMRVDKFPQKADILEPATLDTMFSASAVNPRYARGWDVDESDDYIHGGAFPGQQSLLIRTHDGFCWAVIVNTWSRKSGNFQSDMYHMMWDIQQGISHWPNGEK